jgi:hypothetical protein
MDLAPGTVVERYTVESVLGSGGMATVYRVRHNQLGSLHAMKALDVPTPQVRRRLLREGRLQSNLRHPNVVAVTDSVEIDGLPALVMEYVRGPSLADFLAACRPSVAQIDELARGILRGVAAAHQAGLVHRDLKPGNILLSMDGGTPVPKVTDFGLAKALDAAPGADQTRSGVAMGTPSYMAPEQVRDSASVDHRADLFALGAVLYELLTGRKAFVGSDTFEVFQAVCEGRHTPVDEVVPGLPRRMIAAVEAALQVDPLLRVADCDTLLTTWTGRKGTWTDTPAWDQQTLFTVRSLGSDDDAPSLPPSPSTTDDRTFLLDTARAPVRLTYGAADLVVRECEAGTFPMTPHREVTLTRGLWVAVDPVDAALWLELTGTELPAGGPTWEEAVLLCNRLSQRADLAPAYVVGDPRPRRAYSVDDVGRMLYDLLGFDRIAPVLARFGADTLRVLQFEPERLAEAEGIGPKTASRIARAWDPWRAFTIEVTRDPDSDGWRLPTEAEWAALSEGGEAAWEWVEDGHQGPLWSEVPEPLPAGHVTDPSALDAGPRRLQRRGSERRAVPPERRDGTVRVVRPR